MRSHSAGAFIAFVVAFLIQPLGASPGFGQGTGQDEVDKDKDKKGIVFMLPLAALEDYMKHKPLQVGEEWAYDLCRLREADALDAPAPATDLDPSKSPCGDSFNPSATVTGGHPPYHFQLEPMGGFPPMGMWVDLNGVLRGTPKNAKPATFSVCAVDMGGRSDCQQVTMQAAAPAGAGVNPAVLAVGAGAAVAGGLYAGSVLGDLATTSGLGGTCISERSCIVNTLSPGCSCTGSPSGSCGYMGTPAERGRRCDKGVPCKSGLSCTNGVCEGPGGRCPF
jgi:hypothetical protein